MCIIIYKPKGTEMPSEDVLLTCFENNPHGAGVSYSAKDGVVFVKGLMTYKSFKSTIDAISNKNSRDIVMHFRITTSGGTRPDMCHPFNIGDMISPHKSDCVLHHNGILFTPMTKWYSDTAILAWMFRKNFNKTIELYINKYSLTNRLAIHSHSSGVTLLGAGWISGADGCHYSNDSYIPWTPNYCGKYGSWTDSYRDISGDPIDTVCNMCGGNNLFEFMLNINEITECSDCGHIDMVRY